jgi:hypothetical protein
MQGKNKIFYWIPRILGIIMIVIFTLVAFMVYNQNNKLIHLLFAIAPVLTLVIAWKWEMIGGCLYILLAIAFALYIDVGLGSFFLMILPVALTGILFLIQNWLDNKNNKEIKKNE